MKMFVNLFIPASRLPLVLLCIFFTFCIFFAEKAEAQASEGMVSVEFDMSDFPQWSRDLRRGEIVAFGSFPFVYFFTNFFYDTYRAATHDWNTRYAPWPFKAAGAVEMTQDEQFRTLGIAAGGSVALAIVDHLIVRYQRNKRANELRNLPPGTPIIIRRPLFEDEEEGGDEGGKP